MSKTKRKNLFELLNTFCKHHDDVAHHYRTFFDTLRTMFVAIDNTDGYNLNFSLLQEIKNDWKRDWNLTIKKTFCKCLIQVMVYINTIETRKGKIINWIFIANQTHYCLFHSSIIEKYRHVLAEETAASTAWQRHPDLMKILEKEVNISLHQVTDKIEEDLEILVNSIKQSNIISKIEVNGEEEQMKRLFMDFRDRQIIQEKLKIHEEANIFLGIVIRVFKPVEGEDLLSTKLGSKPQCKMNRIQYEDFISRIKNVIDPMIIDKLVSNRDTIIDEITRRYEGEFFTPEVLERKGTEYKRKYLGTEWYNMFIVWDPTSGLSQLEKRNTYRKLYQSTLNSEDLDFVETIGYNPEAIVKFPYDLLNDDIYLLDLEQSSKIPRQFFEDCKHHPLLIESNFPYGGPGDNKLKGTAKDNIASKTKIHEMMIRGNQRYSKALENLYTQCIFRVIDLKRQLKKDDVHLAMYCPLHLLIGPGYKEFRKLFFENFRYKGGFIVPANTFISLKGSEWPIMYAIFSPGPAPANERSNFVFDYYDKELNLLGEKVVYNLDSDRKVKYWVQQDVRYSNRKIEVPIMASWNNVGIRTRNYADIPSKWPDDALSILVCDSNNIEKSLSSVYILSTDIRSGLGRIKINRQNFYKCFAYFTVRKSSTLSNQYQNSKDEYIYPNINHSDFQRFLYDSVIYSLFNSSSQQVSRGNVFSCSQNWDVINNLFWLDRNLLIELSRLHNNQLLYNHAQQSQDRFLYLEMRGKENMLSQDSKIILNFAKRLVEQSFYKRNELPDTDINRWDAGWIQIVELIKFCGLKSQLKEFNEMYKKFEIRMLEETFKLGFLK